MNNIGIICDLKFERHPLFKSYFYAIENLFGTPRIVESITDLQGIKLLFIGDDHYYAHKDIWQQVGFIKYCNEHNIDVIVFSSERILNSYFPWNESALQELNTFRLLHHYTVDVDDCIALGTKLNRSALSKSIKLGVDVKTKKDKAIFIGSTQCRKNSYQARKVVLNTLRNKISMAILKPNFAKWEDYMRKIAEYRFVLSPLGNGNLFPMRFYEILAVKSIPVQQVNKNTLKYYDIENQFEDCIFFTNPLTVQKKIADFIPKVSHNELWMEDNISTLLKGDGFL